MIFQGTTLKNILLLATSQTMMMSGMGMVVTTSALVGTQLAPDKALATLPFALVFITSIFSSALAGALMIRFGRKKVFVLSPIIAMTAALIGGYSIMSSSFMLFCVSTALFGMFNSFGAFYRFAAADSVGPEHSGRAISYILLGGIVAAFIGPNLANFGKDLVQEAEFAGSYFILVALYCITILGLSSLKLQEVHQHKIIHSSGRSLSEIAKQPIFIVAVSCATLGFATMTFVMTATPLAMQSYCYAFPPTSQVIQWHILAMYAPSLITGKLIEKYGLINMMLVGVVLETACALINLSGVTFGHFNLALILLGVGWNFLFVGGTTLLGGAYRESEQNKVQAANDTILFSGVATASLLAGYLQNVFGWQAVNWGVLPIMLFMFGLLVWYKIYSKPE